jgi:hypothetical protein
MKSNSYDRPISRSHGGQENSSARDVGGLADLGPRDERRRFGSRRGFPPYPANQESTSEGASLHNLRGGRAGGIKLWRGHHPAVLPTILDNAALGGISVGGCRTSLTPAKS